MPGRATMRHENGSWHEGILEESNRLHESCIDMHGAHLHITLGRSLPIHPIPSANAIFGTIKRMGMGMKGNLPAWGRLSRMIKTEPDIRNKAIRAMLFKTGMMQKGATGPFSQMMRRPISSGDGSRYGKK